MTLIYMMLGVNQAPGFRETDTNILVNANISHKAKTELIYITISCSNTYITLEYTGTR